MDGIASANVLPKAESEARVGSGRSRPTKSTAARKDVRVKAEYRAAFVDGLPTSESLEPGAVAGTQALPVDTTNAESPNGRAADFESGSVGSTSASAPKFDKKAWMREYMRGYMREYRKRPKPSIQTTTEERGE
jgi:hypothetical protein